MTAAVPIAARGAQRTSSVHALFVVALVASLALSWMPLAHGAGANCTADQNVCDPDIGEFCGADGFCHAYNCKDFFDFGPLEFTGRNLTVDGRTLKMECAPRDSSDTRIRNALTYGCGGFINSEPPPSKGVSLEFNERCIVRISEITSFECFQMADSTSDTVFDEFENQVNASSVDCEGETDANGDPLPRYIYQIVTAYNLATVESNTPQSVIVIQGINSTTTLDKDIVLTKTMNSLLAVTRVTMPPSQPPSMVPSANPTSVAERQPSGAVPMTGHPMAFILLTMLAGGFAMPFVPEM